MPGILFVAEPIVTVEFFGLARHRAGRAELSVPGRTVAELARGVEATCPRLGVLLSEHGTLSPQYLFSIDGNRFTDDAGTIVPVGGRLLILGADAGG